MYLVLTVTMKGSQRLLVLKRLTQRQLPYKVINRSNSLVAFRQHGCNHWDLLGAGERCDYTWDDPLGTRALQLHASDAAGAYVATSGPKEYTFSRSKANKVVSCADLKLEERATPAPSSPTAELPGTTFNARREKALADPILFSAACTLVTAWQPAPSDVDHEVSAPSAERRVLTKEMGWLCLSATHLLFVPFLLPGAPNEDAAPQRTRPRTTTSTRRSIVVQPDGAAAQPLHQLQLVPLRVEEMVHVQTGTLPGELLVSTSAGGWSGMVVVRSLLTADAVCKRIASQLHKVQGDRYHERYRRMGLERVDSGKSADGSQKEGGGQEGGGQEGGDPDGEPPASMARGKSYLHRRGSMDKLDASLGIQAIVRARQAKRELNKRRTERIVASGNASIADVLLRPSHAPSLLPTQMKSFTPRVTSEPLVEAVRIGNLPEAIQLLAARADPDSTDARGLGALHVACAHHQPAVLQVLLEAG